MRDPIGSLLFAGGVIARIIILHYVMDFIFNCIDAKHEREGRTYYY